MKIKTILICCILTLGATGLCQAQKNNKVQIHVKGDLVSTYVWRGLYQSGAALQPGLGITAGSFSLTAWGSVDLTGQGHKEADLNASYAFGNLVLTLSDYWWAGESGIRNDNENGENNYFEFDNHKTNHIVEAGLSYTLPCEKFPLSLTAYTMLWGADKKTDGKGKTSQAYSTYLEASYPFSCRNIDLVAAIGCSPVESQANYYNEEFAVTNISLKAAKTLKITDCFSLPVFVQTIWNPDREDVHFVLGISI